MSDSEVEIIAISIPADGLVQVQYSERREQSNVAAIQRSIMIDTEYAQEEYILLVDAARELVDKGLILIRSPPQVRAPRGSFVESPEFEHDNSVDIERPGSGLDD